jgi:hypothetical protein
MDKRRRSLLTRGALLAASPLYLTLESFAAQTAPSTTPPRPLPLDQRVLDHWTNNVSKPYQDFIAHNQLAPKGKKADPGLSTFLFQSGAGLILASDTKEDALKVADGDVNITVHVDRFRPSTSASRDLQTMETGSLRIDVKQTERMQELPEALAWTALATLVSNVKGKKPEIEKLDFNPGTAWGNFQTIPLPKGLGFWSWNFFMKRRQGFWGQLIDHVMRVGKIAQPFLPLLGIPGIAVSGLQYVNQILGAVQAQGESAWLFRGLDTAVCATKSTYQKYGGGSALPLAPGKYVVVREADAGKLGGLEVHGGLLVPKGSVTPENPLKVFDVAATTIPEVSYLTVTVGVEATKAPKG